MAGGFHIERTEDDTGLLDVVLEDRNSIFEMIGKKPVKPV